MTNNESMNRPTNTAEQAESYAEIMHALYGDYVNLYFIDPISFTFEAHHQSDIFKKLRLPKKGPVFFRMILDDFIRHIFFSFLWQ